MTEFNRAIAAPDLGDDATTMLRKLTEANTAMAQRLSAATALLREAWHAHSTNDYQLAVECFVRTGDFFASPDTVVQQRADAVRAAYEALDRHQNDGFSTEEDVDAQIARALTALCEAFPELQS